MTKAIYFDMDGTIADLYAVEGWLDMLESHDPTPYKQARPMVRMNTLARLLNQARARGVVIGVVSWLSKGSNEEYNKLVTEAKLQWLHTHLKSVVWDEVHIVPYGTPKHNIVDITDSVLFDDEERNRTQWLGTAYGVDNLIETLKVVVR